MRITPKIKKLIRLYMMDNEMTQADFANLFGLRQTAINKWLNVPNVAIKEDNAKRLCEVLGLDYPNEMYLQCAEDEKGDFIVDTRKDEKSKTARYPEITFTLADIVNAIMASELSSEEKLTMIGNLSKIGLV